MSSQYRQAEAQEMDAVYLMGYDAWSDGLPVAEYLAACRASKKYQSGRWFVLEHENVLSASILVHNFDPWGERVVRGIGSVATQPDLRRRGYGHAILHNSVRELVRSENAALLFLYSDIGAAFYEQHGFVIMPADYQTKQGSVLMIRMLPHFEAAEVAEFQHKIPGYF